MQFGLGIRSVANVCPHFLRVLSLVVPSSVGELWQQTLDKQRPKVKPNPMKEEEKTKTYKYCIADHE